MIGFLEAKCKELLLPLPNERAREELLSFLKSYKLDRKISFPEMSFPEMSFPEMSFPDLLCYTLQTLNAGSVQKDQHCQSLWEETSYIKTMIEAQGSDFLHIGVTTCVALLTALFQFAAETSSGVSASLLHINFGYDRALVYGPEMVDLKYEIAETEMSQLAIRRASPLVFQVLGIACAMPYNRYALPMIYAFLVFLLNASNHPGCMDYMRDYIPWFKIAYFLKVAAADYPPSDAIIGLLPEDKIMASMLPFAKYLKEMFPKLDETHLIDEGPSANTTRFRRIVDICEKVFCVVQRITVEEKENTSSLALEIVYKRT